MQLSTIITVTEMRSMPGRFECTSQKGRGRVNYTGNAGNDPSAAAAYAMQIAMSCGGAYVIFGPKSVLSCIPENLRSRA